MPDIFVSPSPSEGSSTSPPVSSARRGARPAGNANNPFSSYLFMPAGMRFETQQDDETIILLLRKHWVTNFFWLLLAFILLVIPPVLFPLLAFGEVFGPEISASIISFFILVWYLLTFSYILVNFVIWYFTVSIVSTERIIDIDFLNILHKKFAATRISKVEDVTLRRGGFIQNVLDYGDVIVQTAAKDAYFRFDAVPHPEKVVRVINDLMEEIEGEGTDHV